MRTIYRDTIVENRKRKKTMNKEKFLELFADKNVPKPKDYTLSEQKKNNNLVADMLVLEALTVWKNTEPKTLKLLEEKRAAVSKMLADYSLKILNAKAVELKEELYGLVESGNLTWEAVKKALVEQDLEAFEEVFGVYESVLSKRVKRLDKNLEATINGAKARCIAQEEKELQAKGAQC